MLDAVKIGLRKRRSGMTGSCARCSTPTKATSVTSPTAYIARIWAEPHAHVVPPREVAESSRMRLTDSSAMPALSMTTSRAVCARWRKRWMPTKAAIPTGRVMKKSQRQPKWSVTKPPTSGPAIEDRPKMPPIRPWYFPRWRGGMMSPMIVWDSGMRVPMPRPWMARARTRTQKFGARPAMTLPTMKTMMPPR